MGDNEKKSRTISDRTGSIVSDNSSSADKHISGTGGSEKKTVRRRVSAAQSGSRTAGRRISGGQPVRRRLSDDGTEGNAKRRTPEGTEGSARRRMPEGTEGSARRRTPEGTEGSARRRAPEEHTPRQRRDRAKTPIRKQQARRRRKRNLILKVTLFVILVVVAIAGAVLWKKYSPSKEKADLKKYYGIEQEGQLAMTINNEVVEPLAMMADGEAYVRYETVRDYINCRFYWDPNENILLYTLPKDIVRVEVGSNEYSVSKDKNSEDYVILKTEGSTAYIALDFIQKYTNMDYQIYENPDRIMIQTDWGKTKVAEAKKDTQVRYRGGVKSPVLTEISKKDEVVVLENEDNWTKVRTTDGFIGYVKKNALKKTETKNITREFDEPNYTSISEDYTINMVWHNVTNSDANADILDKISETKGLTTIAPTWYHVKNTDGDLESISSSEYVEKAHQMNVDVWATIRDFDGGINSQEETYELLSSTSTREKLINQLIADALQTGIAGINVDFEKVSEECGEHYIQFIRELSVKCRQSELVLSVDNYVPKGYNQQYNRKEQGVFADYVIIMGYDEHFGGSPEAGSVSSYNYVKEGIEETLKEVPAEKVISGLPFYTRLWKETPKTQEELDAAKGTDEEQYTMNVESDALGMSSAAEAVAEAGAETKWDEETKQNYATWTDGETVYEIWLEDTQSLEPKLQLMKDNNLAGTAAWALGQETKETWSLIQKYIN